MNKTYRIFWSGCFLMASCIIISHAQPKQKRYTFNATPVWADEFNYQGQPDSTKWGYDIGGHGWGNNEWQYYTDSGNAIVADGVLNIIANQEIKVGKNFTSARLVSKNKGDFLYGRFEARAKMPKGLGTWPAIWMLPTFWKYGDWPASGEIDIMEHVGFAQDTIHISVHTQAYNHMAGTQKTAVRFIPNVSSQFHTYRIDWTPDYIEGYVDNGLLFTMVRENKTFAEWPFDQHFHWLLNIAVGGNWGGKMGVDEKAFPATMQVDYVRVYAMQLQ